MKKFLFSFLTPLLVSLFFFIPQVKADTIDLSINTSVLDYDNEAYHTLKNYVFNYIENNSNANYYIIYYDFIVAQDTNGMYTNIIDTSKINARIYSNITVLSLTYYAASSSVCNRTAISFPTSLVGYQINVSTLSISTTNNNLVLNQYYCSDNIINYVVIDTNITLNLTRNNTDSVFSLNNRGILSVGNPIPTLVDMYPSSSPDTTPVLTAFYTLVIDKFSVIADFFTDNIYLFALPLIPIFILCIYLIKRSLIK